MKHLRNEFGASKKLFYLALFFVSISAATYAQTATRFGLRAGLNYNANGDYFASVSSNAKHPDRNIGYHFVV